MIEYVEDRKSNIFISSQVNNFITSNPIINHIQSSKINIKYNTAQQNQDLQQHDLTNDDNLIPNISMSTNSKFSPNSKVDVVNPNKIESYVNTYNDIHSTQKNTIKKINSNKKPNKIINNNNEHNTTSTNEVKNVNLAGGVKQITIIIM